MPLITRTNVGVLPANVPAPPPIHTINSGPAGGLAGTATIARHSGHENLITTDMGGDPFEVGLLIGCRPALSSESVIEQYTFKISQLDVRPFIFGGGPIAQADQHREVFVSVPNRPGPTPDPPATAPASYPRSPMQTCPTPA